MSYYDLATKIYDSKNDESLSKPNVTINDIAYSRYKAREKYKNDFLRIFKVPLDKRFFNNLTGFDVIAFDKFISPKDGEDTYSAIERQYGKDGVNIVKGLMAEESRQLAEATTMSSISFLPCQIGTVKAMLKKLAKEKPDWKLEILEGDGESDNEVMIEDRAKFSVPKKHWDEFLGVLGDRINGQTLNLQSILDEAKLPVVQQKLYDHWRGKANTTENFPLGSSWLLSDGNFVGGVGFEHEEMTRMADVDFNSLFNSGALRTSLLKWVISVEGYHITEAQIDSVIRGIRGDSRISEIVLDLLGYSIVIPVKDVGVEKAVKLARNFMMNPTQKVSKAALYHESETEIDEAVKKDLSDLRKELKGTIVKSFTKDDISRVGESVNYWKNIFGVQSYRTNRNAVAVRLERESKDIQKLYGDLLRAYGDDKGSIEMLISNIQDNRPLNSFDVFKNFDYLYGTRVQSVHNDVILVFEATVDYIYTITQSIYIDDEEVLDAIEEDYAASVKRVKNVLYPSGSSFKLTFFDTIKQIIDDMT